MKGIKKSLVIFDLDGTLLNSISDLGAACNHALRSCGYPVHGLQAYPNMVGNGVRKLLERAMPPEEISDANLDRLLELFTEFYDEHCTDMTEPYPGIPELLHTLTGQGINLAVCSNKYQRATTKLVRHFFPDDNWKAILGNTDGMPRKPDPSIVFQALTLCPTPKAEVMYVGDSGVDIETARRACVESVGVTWGFRPVRELRSAYADHIIEHPDELLTLI